MTDPSRRDVLRGVAGAAVTVPTTSLDLDAGEDGEVPKIDDIDDGSGLIWLALSAAMMYDDPQEAADVTGSIWHLHGDPPLSTSRIMAMSRAAANGEYDRDKIARRAERVREREFL